MGRERGERGEGSGFTVSPFDCDVAMEPGEAAVAPCDPYPSAVPMTADDRMGALRAIDRIGAKQFGVFSRAQAAAEGVSLRMMARRRSEGEWLAVLPGIYRFAAVTVT